jgi:hypothetical protein
MYFMKRGKEVYHVLEDDRDGQAPCGVKADRLDLIKLWAGRETPQIMAEKPAGVPLCKHCEKRESAPSSLA